MDDRFARLCQTVRDAFAHAAQTGRPEVFDKGQLDEVTSYDLAIEKELIRAINRDYPDYHICSEEFNPDGRYGRDGKFFVIDPIDGTKNFSHGLFDLYGVQVAQVNHGKIEAAIIYHPATRELFYAVNGQGAFLERRGKARRLTQVTPRPVAKSLIHLCGLAVDEELLDNQLAMVQAIRPQVEGFRILGATCSCMTSCARGRADAAADWYSKPWDFIPGVLLCQEVGFTAWNMEGRPYTVGDRLLGVFATTELAQIFLDASREVGPI